MHTAHSTSARPSQCVGIKFQHSIIDWEKVHWGRSRTDETGVKRRGEYLGESWRGIKNEIDIRKSQRKYLIRRILQMDLEKTHLGCGAEGI